MSVGTELGQPQGHAGTGDLLDVRDLRVEFATDRGWLTVVDGVSFQVGAGETVGLVGESGSGKSVTAMSVLGLLPKATSRVHATAVSLGGKDLLGLDAKALQQVRGNDIAMIFQEPMTSLNPAYTVGEQIAESVRWHRRNGRKAAWKRAVEVLGLVGIPNAAKRAESYPHEFSGGMRQRVMIAMALACEPRLVIADEPTTALDVTIQAQVLDLLREMQTTFGIGVLLITHDLGVVAEVCNRVVVLYAGQVVEEAGVGPLFAEPQHPYTEGLLRSMPQVGGRQRRLDSIPGGPPAPGAMPEGCRFHPRCPYEVAACRAGPVPLLSAGPGRSSRCIRVDEITLRGTRR